MKNLNFSLLALLLSLLMLSCGEEQAKTNDDLKVEYPEELNELDNFEALSLKPYNINALIYVPDATANIGASTAPEIIHEPNGYKWEIKVGQNFHMTIEDWGDENVLKDHLDELENQSVYAIEFLEKEDGFAYYKASLNVKGQEDNNSVGVDHVTYHVVAQHSIEGVNYLFKTNKDGHQKPITDLMAKSVKSVQPISEPS